MGTLDQHTASQFVKLLYIGDSGTGKTGSLASLIGAGYKLRVIDLDNNLRVLVNFAREAGYDLSTAQYESPRDSYGPSPQGPKCKKAKALVDTSKLIDKWSDESVPEEWGPDYILVIDSLSALGRAAFNWAVSMNPMSKEPRQWYHGAQSVVMNILETITADTFQTNVIVIGHVDYVEDDISKMLRGFPRSIGKAIADDIPTLFGTLVLAQSKVQGKDVKRIIKTVPTNMIDLKNPAPMRIDAEYPLETGMKDIFAKLKEV